MTKKELELFSSAITLSDMEVFIFPELMFSLVLANIMSPRIWQWRNDPWFSNLEKMKPYKRITRLKQFIMDHYVFNLDLDSWGLTSQENEIARFSDFIDKDTLAQSNALFGYEGDKYYFDIDIRTHFGLDKYSGNIIPYWKTETVEAMDAFTHRPNYNTGAGECVSLAALYAAALFIVVGIPLDDIFMMATPLHSQNFIIVNDGILTNNRRLVTKNMWFNGTALSAQARRALENERVTIISHISGHIHTIYPTASIAPEAYNTFSQKLSSYLKTTLTKEILGNFLRQCPDAHNCIQIRYNRLGHDLYISAKKAFAYENSSPFRVTDNTRTKLLAEIDAENFEYNPPANSIILNDVEDFISHHRIDLDKDEDVARLTAMLSSSCFNTEIVHKLIEFCHIKPRLPKLNTKTAVSEHKQLKITTDMDRNSIIKHIEESRQHNRTAELAIHAYRDLTRIPYQPYLKACLERNPVSIEACRNMTPAEIIQKLNNFENTSIYDDPGRLAQPDELWNFSRGDGLEKAVTLANILYERTNKPVVITIDGSTASTTCADSQAAFTTTKKLKPQTWHWPV